MPAGAAAPLDGAPAVVSPLDLRPSAAAADGRLFVALAIAHAVVLVTFPSIPVIAIGLWWNANTIAHNFIHRPFFRSTRANRAFSAGLSLIQGIPQDLWRQRHLRHHADARGVSARSLAVTPAIAFETVLVATLWIALAASAPRFFAFVYLPGWMLGLVLCHIHGHYEHAAGTTSHYGRLYNVLFFNDGYHVEHHRQPSTSWRALPSLSSPSGQGSRWPAVLRWLDLEGLERLALRSSALRRFVLDRHEKAFRRLLPLVGPVTRVTIIGGGLFPRTALILRTLLPDATLTIVDASAENLERSRPFLPDNVTIVRATYEPGMPVNADLVVIPLAYRGDRQRLYAEPPAANVILHDWVWAPQARTTRVSWLLLKRLNLARRTAGTERTTTR